MRSKDAQKQLARTSLSDVKTALKCTPALTKKCMATFLANEINATDRDVTGPTEQVQIMFPLKDKNIN